MEKIKMLGSKYGKVTVIKELPHVFIFSKNGNRRGETPLICKCECGKTFVSNTQRLRSGNTKSCGCWRAGANKQRATHNQSGIFNKSKEYETWLNMKSRCYNPKNIGYHLYGGRGITVCKKWRGSYEAFYSDMGPRPSNNHSIERKNNEKGYSKRNCKWDIRKNQVRNRRVTKRLNFNGKLLPLAEICEIVGKDYSFINSRLINGWTIEEAIKYPVHTKIKSKRRYA